MYNPLSNTKELEEIGKALRSPEKLDRATSNKLLTKLVVKEALKLTVGLIAIVAVSLVIENLDFTKK